MNISLILNLTTAKRNFVANLKSIAELTINNDWSPFLFKTNYRKGDCWESCNVIALDIDDGCTIEQAKEYFKEYQYVITTSKSHMIEKNGKICERFRIILPLSETIKDKDLYKNTWYSLSNKYPFIDQQCKDFARFFYKGKKIVEIKTDGKKIDPVVEEIESTKVSTYKVKTPLNKGKLSRFTMEFLTWGGEEGHWNSGLFKAAKDFHEQGYSMEEFIDRAEKITGALDGSDLKTIESAFTSDPKYAPRGVTAKQPLIANCVKTLIEKGELSKKGGNKIYGPRMFDCTEWRWRKGESLGLIAGSGCGKSSLSLKIIKETILNNKDNDDIHFFFTLEMTAKQVIERWLKLVDYDEEIGQRLFVIDNEQVEERIGWQHIVRYVEDTCAQVGKKPGCIIIDHFKALSNKIDIDIKPNFDVSFDMHSGFGKIKNININEMCRLINKVAKTLDAFIIVQNQSTKGRAGDGDLPMGIDAAHGAADFEWFCDYVLTVWQPLKKVKDITELTTSAWQYCKIREQGKNDLTSTYVPHVLYYNLENGDYRKMTELEWDEFRKAVSIANERRKDAKKDGYNNYHDIPENDMQISGFIDRKEGNNE